VFHGELIWSIDSLMRMWWNLEILCIFFVVYVAHHFNWWFVVRYKFWACL